jgi:hypothetical protein
MQQRNRSVSLSAPVLVLVAVLALVVGSFGSAVAGPVTKAQVKKIAKGVVKKNAKHLTVANSNTLAGQPPAAYQDQSSVYTVSVTALASGHDVTIPLTPGLYLVSYSLRMNGGSGASGCYLRRDRGSSVIYLVDQSTSSGGNPAVSASGHVDVVTGDVVRLICYSSSAWTTLSSEPLQIVATPVDSVSNAALTAG